MKNKNFKLITLNGVLLYCNARCTFDDGIVSIDNYRFEPSKVKRISVDKKTDTVTLDFTGDKVDDLCESIGSVSEYADSLAW